VAFTCYIKKKWFFTVMKSDTMQMKRKPDGSYDGEVTPTRFTFVSDKLVYPLKMTQISVKDRAEALFYVQTTHKVDLPGDFSYEFTFAPMWSQATSFAVSEKLTKEETAWQKHIEEGLAMIAAEYRGEGYDVIVHPRGDQVPPVAGGYEPELIAVKDGEKAIVLVKAIRKALQGDTSVLELGKAVDSQSEWRLDLVVLNL
jgi:hypothetical protein